MLEVTMVARAAQQDLILWALSVASSVLGLNGVHLSRWLS